MKHHTTFKLIQALAEDAPIDAIILGCSQACFENFDKLRDIDHGLAASWYAASDALIKIARKTAKL